MTAGAKLRLVIDLGHGGEDPGAVHAATGLREADVARRLWVLRKARRPAVLVECAFISNPEEAQLLGDELNGFKERLAVAVFEGLRASLLGERETERIGKEVSV